MRELTDEEVFGQELSDAEVFKTEPERPLYQPSVLPLRRGADGSIEFTVPQVAKELWQGIKNPGDILSGKITPTMDNLKNAAIQTTGAITTGSIAAPRVIVPAGSAAMNAVGPPIKTGARALTKAAGTVAETVAEPISARFNADNAVARSLLRQIKNQNPGLSDEEAITATELQLKRLGPDAVLADTGKGLQKLGRNMAQAPGETAQRAEDMLNSRRAGEKTAVIGSIKQNISNRDFYDSMAEARKARAKSGPVFQEAYRAYPNLTSDKLRLMADQDPIIKKAMEKGISLERTASTEAGEKFDPESFGVVLDFNEAGDPIITEIPKTPLKLWHATKRGLDTIISKRKNALGKIDKTDPETASLMSLRSALDRELKSLTGGDAGAYAKANRIAADTYRLEEALDSGRAFARGDEEITARLWTKMSPKEKDAYRTGVAREMVAMIRRNSGNLTPSQIMASVQDEAGIRQKLKIIAPSQKQFDSFMTDLERRLKFRETDRATRNVSQTGSILLEEGAVAGDALGAASKAGGIAVDLGRGNVAGAISRTVQWGAEQLRRLQMPQDARNRIGRMLYSQDPKDQQEALDLIRAQIRTKYPAGR